MTRDDWVEVELGHVCEKAAKVKRKEMPPEQRLIYIDIGGIDNALNKIVDHKEYTWSDAPSRAQQVVKVGDVLFSTVRTYLRNIAQVTNQKHNNEICSSGFTVIRGRQGTLYPRYAFYITLFEGFIQPLNELQTGTSYPAVRDRDVFAQKIPLAPLPEQRAIVAKIEQLFSELDNGIANLRAAKEKLEIYRQTVLKKAFEGELTVKWRAENPYTNNYINEVLAYVKEFNAQKQSQDVPNRLPNISLDGLFALPYGWVWLEAHKICQSVRDGTHDTPKYVDDGIPLATSKNLKHGAIDFSTASMISVSDHEDICRRSGVEENDILFAMIGTIGNPVIVKHGNEFSIKNVGLFKKNEELIKPKYLMFYLSSWVAKRIMKEKDLIRGTTQQFVPLGGLRVLPIPLPSLPEQEKIVAEIETRLSICDNFLSNVEQGLEKAEALRQSILEKAFEGKLLSEEELEACRNEPDWEPADKLLERLKK